MSIINIKDDNDTNMKDIGLNNNEEYTLREIQTAMDRYYMKEDVKWRLDEESNSLDIDEIIDEWRSILDDNDGYWESYWDSLNVAIDNCKEGV